MASARLTIFFDSESHILAMTGDSFRDKAYAYIRCEAKLGAGATGMVCSRKGIV